MKRLSRIAIILFSLLVVVASADDPKSPASIPQFTSAMQKMDGFFPVYWDQREGKLWLEISRFDQEFLFLDSLPAGIGSNDIGLDRGQVGHSRVVRFLRVGPKVLLEEVNYAFRATGNDLEKKSVHDAFAQSVIWAGKVSAEQGGHVLVDATDFFLSDAHGAAETLKRTKQGSFRVDKERSAIYLRMTKNFPRNTEVESVLTFEGEEPGEWVRDVTPDGHSITVREHYSFMQLPEPGFKPRRFDPRSGFINIEFADYSAPIGASLNQRFIVRHRLEKREPNAALSEPVKPIVYYLDPATPEPVRSALLEGAGWWAQAFEAAGFRNAFIVKVLPPDADPMDARYNVIEWVHRATRGWSYGEAVVDPRTGEIIKGHVLLGSLRMRQDYMILQGLLNSTDDPRILQTVLARLRQLAAHEVGHTLGLQHNYIASTQDRSSVMDYPAPLITAGDGGAFDLKNAYAVGIGEWDKVAITYGYAQPAPGANEDEAIGAVIANSLKRGVRFLTDQDARPAGSMNPYTHMWDNGRNAVDELNRVLEVRGRALSRYGAEAIAVGTPMAELEDVLVPIYLYHRYQVEAATKVIGGYDYTYALRGDGQKSTTAVTDAEQRRALAAVLKTIAPETLALPERLNELIPPHPSGVPRTRESFPTNTLGFDPMGAAQAAAQITVELLLNPARAERLMQQHERDPKALGFDEVLESAFAATWKADQGPLRRVAGDVVLAQLLRLAREEHTSAEVRGMAQAKLHELREWAVQNLNAQRSAEQRAHLLSAVMQIRSFEEGTGEGTKAAPPVEVPPGAPIGTTEEAEDFVVPR
ncbi:MAG: zinc-dependent metalloprotease [Acidobacteriaceae bacterium]